MLSDSNLLKLLEELIYAKRLAPVLFCSPVPVGPVPFGSVNVNVFQ